MTNHFSLAVSKASMKEKLGFIDGLMYAVQEMAISHRHDDFAGFLMLGSGLSKQDFLQAQKRTGFKNREMNKLIRYTFRNQAYDQ